MIKIPLDNKIQQIGVYVIRNKINGKVYIGSSKNCYHRVRSQHLWSLENKTHTNPHLQSSWNKYGKSAFEFFIIELCEPENILIREQFYIDSMTATNREFGYNANQLVNGSVKLNEEQKMKLTFSKQGKSLRDEKFVGVFKSGKNWMARISYRGDDRYIGSYRLKEDAARAYNLEAKRIYGASAILNPVTDEVISSKIKRRKSHRRGPILQLDSNFNIVGRFEHAAAARKVGFHVFPVLNTTKMHKGFYWRQE